jgi:hypothetical protein
VSCPCCIGFAAGDDADILRVYGVARSLELCEADNEVLRLQEELPLLRREMQAHSRYWRQQIDRQQQVEGVLLDVSSQVCDAVAAGLFNDELATQYAQLLKQSMQAIDGGVSFPNGEQQQGRYQASAAQLLAWPGALTGALSVVRIAQQEAKGHLARAVAAFAPFASLPQPSSAGDAAAATAAAAAAATAAAHVDAANDAHWDDVGSEDEAWVPSDVDVDEEAELDMERDE